MPDNKFHLLRNKILRKILLLRDKICKNIFLQVSHYHLKPPKKFSDSYFTTNNKMIFFTFEVSDS